MHAIHLMLKAEQKATGTRREKSCLYLVELLLLPEGAYLLPNLLNLLRSSTLDDVVSAGILIGSDEVGVVNARQRHMLLHVGHKLPLQLPVKYLQGGSSLEDTGSLP